MKLRRGLFLIGVFAALAMYPLTGLAQENPPPQSGWDLVKDSLYPVLFTESDAKKFSEQAVTRKGEPPLFKPFIGDLTTGYVMIRQEDKVFLLPSHLQNFSPTVTLDEVHDAAKKNLSQLFSGAHSPFIVSDDRNRGIENIIIHSRVPWQARLTPSLLLLHEKVFSLSDSFFGGLFKEKKYYALPMRHILPITNGSEMRSGFLDFIVHRVRLDKKTNFLLSEYIYEISSDGVVPFRKAHNQEPQKETNPQ